jgi:hypothetical protein
VLAVFLQLRNKDPKVAFDKYRCSLSEWQPSMRLNCVKKRECLKNVVVVCLVVFLFFCRCSWMILFVCLFVWSVFVVV